MDVMIVDDEPAARRTVRECCEREADLRVVGEFGDPRAALEAIRSQRPHVLFLDIQMDSLSGMALARALDPEFDIWEASGTTRTVPRLTCWPNR